eukprot:1055247-Amphidinium_carterae.1
MSRHAHGSAFRMTAPRRIQTSETARTKVGSRRSKFANKATSCVFQPSRTSAANAQVHIKH